MFSSENNITIQRGQHNKEHPYVMISKAMLKDTSLSLREKGALSYLLSMPDNWVVHPRHAAESLGISKNQMYGILKELIAKGYATKEEIKDSRGRFSSVKYRFYEEKLDNAEDFQKKIAVSQKPVHGKIRVRENPCTEKGTLKKTESSYLASQEDPDLPSVVLKKESTHTPPNPEGDSATAEVGVVSDHSQPPDAMPPDVPILAEKLIAVMRKHSSVYRPPRNMKPFLDKVYALLHTDKQKEADILAAFEWAVQDTTQRGDFNGWSGIVMNGANGLVSFRKNFMLINRQSLASPKRKFAEYSRPEELKRQAAELMEGFI